MPRRGPGAVEIIGLFVSDIHLSETAPVSRAEKKTWMSTDGPQVKALKQLKVLQEEHQCPVFIAGDLFDRWNASAWVINLALVHLPDRCYAIPGNHDLMFGSYRDIERTAYWTLVEAGKVTNLTPGPGDMQHSIDHLLVSPFPHTFPVQAPKDKHGLALNVALVHDLIWTEKTGYEGASADKRLGKWLPKLSKYDAAFWGDNHRGFIALHKEGQCRVMNCGAFIRRKSNEMVLTPSVGMLHSNGTITRHFLDVSEDQWSDVGQEIADIESSLQMDLSGFIEELVKARDTGWNWEITVDSWISGNNIDKDVAAIMKKAVKEV